MEHNYSIEWNSVILFPLNEQTSEKYRILRNNKNIHKWFFHSSEISELQQKEWFETYKNREDDIMFSIHLNDEKRTFIGANAIYAIQEEDKMAEYGRVIIDPQFTGRGFGYSATLAACIFAKNVLKLNKLVLEVYKENIAALNMYRKAGFKHSGMMSGENNIICMEKTL